MSIVEKLSQHAKQTPEKLAVVFEGEEISYSELWEKSVRLAHLFKKLGLRDGDRVICQCKHDLYYVATIYAAHLCGAAVVPVDKNADGKMIADIAEHIDASLAVCNQIERFPNCVLYGEVASILPEDTSMNGLAFPDSDSIAVIIFTTGTTGAPKGVQLTHRNTIGWTKRCSEMNSSAESVNLIAVPLNHVAPFMRLNQTIRIGGTQVFLESMMKLGLMFEYMDKYGVTSMFCPPSCISLFQQLVKGKMTKYADQLEYIISGSSAMTVSQQDYMKDVLPHTRLYTSYASSEAGLVAISRYDKINKAINCCGKPCQDVEFRIMDDAFHSLPAGQVGLIAIKSDMTMKGYYNRPDLTDAVLQDGFFISGDLGYMDEEGYLYVCGRSDDMINIGGLKVFPSEIENATLNIPGIIDCICFSIPDSVTGQAVKLLIQTDASFSGTTATVQEALSRMMDAYKVPKQIEIVPEIIKTANGKPNRKFYQAENQ